MFELRSKQVGKSDTDEVTWTYNKPYQNDSVAERALVAFDKIAQVLVHNFHPKTAIDVGSGGGALIRGFERRGVDAVGIEGSVHAVALYPDRIHLADLRATLPREIRGMNELTTSFDVAEHISPEYADTLVDNVISVTAPWGAIVFGPAPEGQDGLGHINCQHPTYWIEKFAAKGFDLFPAMSNKLRTEIKSHPEASFLWWVAKNLMVFHMGGLSHRGRMWLNETHWKECNR